MTQIDQGWLQYYIGRSLRKKAAAPFREPSHVTECSLSRRTWLSKRSFDDLIKICLELDYDKVISVKIANIWKPTSKVPQWRPSAIEFWMEVWICAETARFCHFIASSLKNTNKYCYEMYQYHVYISSNRQSAREYPRRWHFLLVRMRHVGNCSPQSIFNFWSLDNILSWTSMNEWFKSTRRFNLTQNEGKLEQSPFCK